MGDGDMQSKAEPSRKRVERHQWNSKLVRDAPCILIRPRVFAGLVVHGRRERAPASTCMRFCFWPRRLEESECLALSLSSFFIGFLRITAMPVPIAKSDMLSVEEIVRTAVREHPTSVDGSQLVLERAMDVLGRGSARVSGMHGMRVSLS